MKVLNSVAYKSQKMSNNSEKGASAQLCRFVLVPFSTRQGRSSDYVVHMRVVYGRREKELRYFNGQCMYVNVLLFYSRF